MDGFTVLSAWTQSSIRGISLHRRQPLGRRWRRTVSLRQRGLSHADSEESAAAGFEILPEIFPDEAVTVCQRQRIDIIFNVHWINHDDATRVDLRMRCFVQPGEVLTRTTAGLRLSHSRTE